MKASMKARRRLEVVVVVGAAVVRRRLERDLWDAHLIVVVVKLLKLCCLVGSCRSGAWYPWPWRDVSHVRLRCIRAIREVGHLCAHY